MSSSQARLNASNHASASDSFHTASTDPLAAITSLDLGEFVAEAFISEALAKRMHQRSLSEPEKIRKQLEELLSLYSEEKTLNILGAGSQKSSSGEASSMATTLCQMLEAFSCQVFDWHAEQGKEQLVLLGSSSKPDQAKALPLAYQQESPQVQLLKHLFAITPLQASYVLPSEASNAKALHLHKQQPKLPSWPTEAQEQAENTTLLAPLLQQGKPVGVLLLQWPATQPLYPETAYLLEHVATFLIAARSLQRLLQHVEQVLQQKDSELLNLSPLLSLRAQLTESIADLNLLQQGFLKALAQLMDRRHHYESGHSHTVAKVAQAIAEQMSLNEKTVDLIFFAGLFGNVGQFRLSGDVAGKLGSLNDQEWEKVKQHPNLGVTLMLHLYALGEVAPYVKYQNERWDGTGQPEGLKGRDIPLGSRILAVAQAYRALLQQRPYRQEALSHSEALLLLQQEQGSKWDAMVVQALAATDPQELMSC